MEPLPNIPESILLEHQIAQLMASQEAVGWPFDVRAAQELENTLLTRLERLREAAQKLCWAVPGNEFTPKRDNKTHGYIEGASYGLLRGHELSNLML